MRKTTLLVIDVQKGVDAPAYWGMRNNLGTEANMAWREGNGR